MNKYDYYHYNNFWMIGKSTLIKKNDYTVIKPRKNATLLELPNYRYKVWKKYECACVSKFTRFYCKIKSACARNLERS